MKFPLYVQIFLLLALVFGGGMAGASRNCEGLLSGEFLHQPSFYFLQILAGEKGLSLEKYEQLEGFQNYLKENQVSWKELDDSSQWKIISLFVENKLKGYTESHLSDLRFMQLSEELKHRGYLAGDVKSFEGFAEVSRQNKLHFWSKVKQRLSERFEASRIVTESNIILEIEETVDKLYFHFAHNTSQVHQNKPIQPILSAKEIARLSPVFTLNSLAFNRDILKTDGNVYFFMKLAHREKRPPYVESAYGKINWAVSEKQVDKIAWASPFVMQPYELIDFMRENSPGKYQQFVNIIAERFQVNLSDNKSIVTSLSSEQREILMSEPELWQPLVQELHHFDFTLQDINLLLKKTLSEVLLYLYGSDTNKYEQVLKELKNGDQLEDVMQEWVLPLWGMTHGLEMKIPIAVNSQDIFIVRPPGDVGDNFLQNPMKKRKSFRSFNSDEYMP